MNTISTADDTKWDKCQEAAEWQVCEEPTGWMSFRERLLRAQHKKNGLHSLRERYITVCF